MIVRTDGRTMQSLEVAVRLNLLFCLRPLVYSVYSRHWWAEHLHRAVFLSIMTVKSPSTYYSSEHLLVCFVHLLKSGYIKAAIVFVCAERKSLKFNTKWQIRHPPLLSIPEICYYIHNTTHPYTLTYMQNTCILQTTFLLFVNHVHFFQIFNFLTRNYFFNWTNQMEYNQRTWEYTYFNKKS